MVVESCRNKKTDFKSILCRQKRDNGCDKECGPILVRNVRTRKKEKLKRILCRQKN